MSINFDFYLAQRAAREADEIWDTRKFNAFFLALFKLKKNQLSLEPQAR